MNRDECAEFLRWALPRLRLRPAGFRRVRSQVCKRLARRLRELRLPDLAAYRRHLERHPQEWAHLDACCRITISRFHRDREVFHGISTRVLPVLATAARRSGRSELNAWSAGCGAGEEPYTIRAAWDLPPSNRPDGSQERRGLASAEDMAPARRFPDLDLRVLATDADPGQLERAQRGCYPASSLRDLPPEWLPRLFEPSNDEFCLRAEARRGVELRCQDLREGAPPGPFDLILCRNLAFTYFDPPLQERVLAQLCERLMPGGALVVGIHETLPECEARLEPWHDLRAVHRRVRWG